jgi:hypothetical protein
VPLGTSYVLKTLRLLSEEELIFTRACHALGGMELSQLMQEAVLFEASRQGVRFSTTAPDPYQGPWAYLPERGDTATGVRITISMRVTVAELMAIAAAQVRVSEPLFIIGSTLAYIGRLQRCFQGSQLASEGDRDDARAALKRITLPPRYRYRSRG